MLKSLHGNIHLLVDVRFVFVDARFVCIGELPYARRRLSERITGSKTGKDANVGEDEGSEAEAEGYEAEAEERRGGLAVRPRTLPSR